MRIQPARSLPRLSSSLTARRRQSVRAAVEAVERRTMLAVTASFVASSGVLSVIGDSLDNPITLSRDAAGTILVNGGAVPVVGGPATVANTSLLQVFGQDGNDTITLSEVNGALPASNLFGGAANDVITGGSGADQLFGQAGNDVLLGKGGVDLLFGGSDNDVLTGGTGDDQSSGETGDDRMVWNPGEGTDLNEGGDGIDTTEVNGGNGAEQFTTTANGTRVRFDRVTPAPFSLDIGTTENLVVNCNGGDDSFTAGNGLATLISITADGGAGNDSITGGDGADILLGGDGNDLVVGGRGNDVAFLGAGDDTFVWNPGDGSDVVEGQANNDRMLFNGANVNENTSVSANGGRVRFTRDVANITMDLNDVEAIDLKSLGGADTTTLTDLSGTDLVAYNVDLASPAGSGAGDGAADSVIVNGTNLADVVTVTGAGTSYSVAGLAATLNVTGSEGANDHLTINTLAGNDSVAANVLPAGVVGLSVDGAADNDTILDGAGADQLIGGDGNDFIDGNQGNDVAFLGANDDTFQWDPGDGSDIVEGQAGADKMVFNGSNAAENIDVSANGGRVRFSRDVGAILMDLDDVERIDFNALGGIDGMTVNDLSGTDLAAVNLDLKASAGGSDGQADSVVVNGTQGNDTIGVAGSAAGVSVTGLQVAVSILNTDPALDALTINALGLDDTIDASGLAAGALKLTENGGSGVDLLVGSAGDDVLAGGTSNDVVLAGNGNDTMPWNPGDGSDTDEGQAGEDVLLFNGANITENIGISANGGRVRFTRDVANIVMDVNGVERIDFNALGGADNITVNSLLGTDLTSVNLDLASTVGGTSGDGAADTVNVNGSNGVDVLGLTGDNVTGVHASLSGLAVNVRGHEPANDRFNFNLLAGTDVVTLGAIQGISGTLMNFNLSASSAGDGAADTFTIPFTSAADSIGVTDAAVGTNITGGPASISVANADANDVIKLLAGAGGDFITINQNGSAGSVRQVQVDGGTELDSINVANTAADGAAIILPSAGNDNVSVNTDGLFQANAVLQFTQRIGILSGGANGRASIGGDVNTTLTVLSLNLASTARLDIGRSNFVVDYIGPSVISSVSNLVKSGFANGAWNGPGIVSSAAAADVRTAVGYADASAIYATFPADFHGQLVDSTSILVSYTLKGDTNLSRSVTFDDLLALAQNYGVNSGAIWSQGDFDYNNAVNFADLLSLAQNYNVPLLESAIGSRIAKDVLA